MMAKKCWVNNTKVEEKIIIIKLIEIYNKFKSIKWMTLTCDVGSIIGCNEGWIDG